MVFESFFFVLLDHQFVLIVNELLVVVAYQKSIAYHEIINSNA